jgi:hypothetical protein
MENTGLNTSSRWSQSQVSFSVLSLVVIIALVPIMMTNKASVHPAPF